MKKAFAWMVPEGDIVQGTVTAVHRDPGRLRLVVHFEVEVVEYLAQTGTFGWIPQSWLGAAPPIAECEVELGLAQHLVDQVAPEKFAEDVLNSFAESLPAAMHSSRWRILRARTADGAVATVWSRPAVSEAAEVSAVVQAVLDEESWGLEALGDGLYAGERVVSDVAIHVAVQANDRARTVTTLARLPFEVAEARLAEAGLVLHLVNAGLPFGSFDLAVEQRTITFRTTQLIGHGSADASVVRTHMVAGVALAAQHAETLVELAV